ncbi:MAG: hypothetical protein KAS62_01835, partial [Candidatus Delongbacteria bacterium]|nr:hypothetical protein [Candidatus Delongbacteria bacterium]
MKKILFILLILIQITAYSQFAGGSGSESDPFQVATAEHLNNVRYYLDSCFVQIADIDLGVAPWNEGEGWEPIGKYTLESSTSFRGRFNGHNFKISNLYINKPDSFHVALFGSTIGSKIFMVNLNNISVTGYGRVGGLIGYCFRDSIVGCNAYGEIIGDKSVGGLIGGTNDSTYIANCSSVSIVKGRLEIGGFCGSNSFQSTIRDSYFIGSVIGLDSTLATYIGGFVGDNYGSTIENCFSQGEVSNNYIGLGGFAGSSERWGVEAVIKNCYSTCAIIGDADKKGGLVGYERGTAFTNSYWDIETSGMTPSAGGEGRTTEDMTYPYSDDAFVDWDFNTIWTYDLLNTNDGYPFFQWQLPQEAPSAPSNFIATAYPDGGYGVDLSWENPTQMINGDPLTELLAIHLYRDSVLIYTVSDPIIGDSLLYTDLPAIADYYNYSIVGENSYGYGIMAIQNNIMVGLFSGGEGTEAFPYEIATAEQLNNVRKYKSSYYLQIADIDLGVLPWNVGEGWEPIGDSTAPFSGNYDGGEYIIYNLSINRNLSNTVGFFGSANSAFISNVFLQNTYVIGNDNTGGLLGSSNSSTITNCYTLGEVTGNKNTGGLVGYNFRADITESYTDCEVMGNENTGGFVGLNYNLSKTDNCYSVGNVNCESNNAGGFAGNNYYSTISNSYSTGAIDCAGSNVGGFVGIEAGDGITGCYWDTERSGISTSDGGEGRTTIEMTIPHAGNTYIGWDFANIWGEDDRNLNLGYPILQLTTGIMDNGQFTIDNYELEQNYPNPFNPST